MSQSRLHDEPPAYPFWWRYAPVALLLGGVGVALNGAVYTNGTDSGKSAVAIPRFTSNTDVERQDRTEALQRLQQSRHVQKGVRDYRCTLTTRERVRGELLPTQVMDMECRVGAFAVHLRWREPSANVGQEVWFGEGLNQGKMRVRAAGYLGTMVGVISMDPHSPTVRENSRHAITEAGMGTMLEQFAQGWESEPEEDCHVRLGASLVAGQSCRTIEVRMMPSSRAEWHYGILHIEEKRSIPVRVEYYDSEGRLLDEATYQDLQLNVGLDNKVFRR